jgi:DNA-binding MarR family transcriptional regulator
VSRPTTPNRDEPPFDLRSAIAAVLPDVDPDVVQLHLTLLHLGRIVEAPANRLLSADGLELSERWVLIALLFSGPPYQMSPTLLSRSIQQTTSGMSKTLRRLEGRGLVDRVPDPADGRGRLVHLTERGVDDARDQLRQLAGLWEERLAEVAQGERSAMARAAWSLVQSLDPSFAVTPLLND